MSKISGELDLSQVEDVDLLNEIETKVLVVQDDQVLGSAVLKPEPGARSIPFEVEFAVPILPGFRRPCPVVLIVGPNVADHDLLSLDTFTQVVELNPRAQGGGRKEKAAAEPRGESEEATALATYEIADVKLGRLLIDPLIFRCWLICCRTYTIRGRVVCRHWRYNPRTGRWGWCDEPVPGARVEAFDVDCFWWWCRRDLITTATTNINGQFEMKFTWCCRRFWPWLRPNWTIDPDLLRRIQEALRKVKIPIPPVPPGPDPDPWVFEQLIGNPANLPGSVLRSASARPELLSAAAGATSVSADALLQVLPRVPELEALHVWPWWPLRDCAPDVVFRVHQRCNGAVNVIVDEPNSAARWNIPTTLNVTLVANDKACCDPVCRDPECPECVSFSEVGCTPATAISTSPAPVDLRGYANTASMGDNPFYGQIPVRGNLGYDVDYYKVQYSRDGGPWLDMPIPVFGGFDRKFYDGTQYVSAPAPGFTPALKNGRTVMISRRHFEQTHPALPTFGGYVHWNDYTTLFNFDTEASPAVTPDGLYELRLVGYSADAADNLILSSQRILPFCGSTTAATLFVRLDNRRMIHPASTPLHPCNIIHACTNEPDCFIRSVCKNEGTPSAVCISACDIVRLDPSDTLTIHFTVSVPPNTRDGHLGGYWLRAEFGVSEAFYIGTAAGGAACPTQPPGGPYDPRGTFQPDPTFEVGPTYDLALGQGAPRPHWYGGDYKVTLRGCDFPVCCAYLLRLWAWKRTTNGCSSPSSTHYNQFEMTFTVLRPDLCPDVCPDPNRRALPAAAESGAAQRRTAELQPA